MKKLNKILYNIVDASEEALNNYFSSVKKLFPNKSIKEYELYNIGYNPFKKQLSDEVEWCRAYPIILNYVKSIKKKYYSKSNMDIASFFTQYHHIPNTQYPKSMIRYSYNNYVNISVILHNLAYMKLIDNTSNIKLTELGNKVLKDYNKFLNSKTYII